MSWLREPNSEPIPGYRLIEPLGSGGFGEVWKCEAPGGIHKAIKFVFGNLNSLDVDSIRAEQELHALERVRGVRHPFVCSLDRIEKVDGELVIVMELAERTLHDLFMECKGAGLIGIPRDDLLRYLRDAAEALDYMNEKHNLQHLDVKPRNLFVIAERVKVADFGLVKHLERQTATGLMGGVTPLYAPPETFSGKISVSSDQYSLAIVYQELLTGQRPFAGKNVRQLAHQHMKEDPDLRALPEAERPVVARCLEKDPAKRFPNCMAFLAALYRARNPARHEPEPLLVGAKKSKSIVETMEDIVLEGIGDFHASPRPRTPAPVPDEIEAEDLGITIPQPETGALRPTLIIGLGGFGRKALLELRCRFLDRFGDLNKLPLLKFLCIDADREAANLAIRGAPEVALTRNEVHCLPLQPVGNYRKRMLEQLSEWLPREKLYSMPRSLQPQGTRALGRLAFADNQQRLVGRLKREIQEITMPDAIYHSVSRTGLALRDNTARIYIIGAAGGGCSGMLVDLGYAVRRLLQQLRQPDARVNCFLFCGAPTDPATPRAELANTYATLTEINHYSDCNIPFAAEYGVDGQRLVDQGAPFHSIYMLPLQNRSPECLDAVVSHLGSYMFHELTTPLGLRLDNLRHGSSSGGGSGVDMLETPLRSFGTYAVWFPRGLLLRMAARQALRRTIDSWLAEGNDRITTEAAAQIDAFIHQVTIDPSLQPEALAHQIESSCQVNPLDLEVTPAQALTGMLAALQEQALQSVAQEDPANWARQALNRVHEWVGTGAELDQEMHEWRKTRLNRALSATAQKVAEQLDKKISDDMFALMECAGARVAAAEKALERLQKYCLNAMEEQKEQLSEQLARTNTAWKQVEVAQADFDLHGGGFRLFGGRSRGRQLRAFMEALSHFARQRLTEEIIAAVRHFFAALHSRLGERARDLSFCRQRLRHLQEHLENGPIDSDEAMATTRPNAEYTMTRSPIPSAESFWEMIRQSDTARVLLPDNEQDLERAAIRFLQRLPATQWVELDKSIHERALLPRGGLHKACINSGDLSKMLAEPLLEETATILSEHLPIMDVAQILNAEFGVAMEQNALNIGQRNGDLTGQVDNYTQRATPLISGVTENQASFLLVPASPSGKSFGDAVRTVLPDIKVVRVPGQSDLMFCREQSRLKAADLERLLKPCRAAYEEFVANPTTSPHARFDVMDWVPLDP